MRAGRVWQLALIKVFGINPIIGGFAGRAAVLQRPESLVKISPAGYDRGALGFARLFRNDVDDSIDGISSPDRTAGAADDFDPCNVFQRKIEHVPPHAAERGRVDGSAVNHCQKLVAKSSIETTRTNGPRI